jgi:threonine dehydrogenase-like Zn-dependent dehydrogenase
MAKSLGATHTLHAKRDGDPKELAANIAQIVKHQGGLDFAIDTTGVPAVLRMAVESLRATGVAALLGGSPPGSELKVDMLTCVEGEVCVCVCVWWLRVWMIEPARVYRVRCRSWPVTLDGAARAAGRACLRAASFWAARCAVSSKGTACRARSCRS